MIIKLIYEYYKFLTQGSFHLFIINKIATRETNNMINLNN